MVVPHEKLTTLLAEIRGQLVRIYGPRLAGIYLYGSYARGEADEDSDIDLAVVLDGPVNFWMELDRTNGFFSALSLRENCLINTMFFSKSDLESKRYSIHRSVIREGQAI